MKKLLFISKDNLTTNPRLAKELKFAINDGYRVDFVGFEMDSWSKKIEIETSKNISASLSYISASRKPFLNWIFSSLIEKVAKILYPYFNNNLKVNAFAHSKRTFLLCRYFSFKKEKYDLIIAHTLPTLYPAYKLSKKLKIPFIFDIEDYHPGESIIKDSINETKRRKFIMKTILPKASFITYASPLIGKYSIELIDNFPHEKLSLINNCFSETEFQFKENNSEKIKFVWFSQNIAQGRGLEFVLPALQKFKNQIEITLIGNLYQEFYNTFLYKYSDFIYIEKPLHQKDLNLKLSEFDIGLAIELNTADFNRQICLTNKIWAYFQSGLYILATDTPAQVQFLQEHKTIGTISKQDSKSFENSIGDILYKIEKIRDKKQTRFVNAQKFTWENESRKLAYIWSKILL